MKCDELQSTQIYASFANEAYDDFGDSCQEQEYYRKEHADAAIAELKERISEERSAKVDYKISANDLSYGLHDALEKNRKLKRVLWLARAERAVAEQTVDEWSRYKEKHPFGSWRVDPFEYWVQAWICVEKICRKKAEEYK